MYTSKLRLFIIALACVMGIVTANAYPVETSFSDMTPGALPEGWTTWGTDKTPAGPAEGLFDKGQGFTIMPLEGFNGNFAVSYSSTTEGGNVSTALVTPQIELPASGGLIRFSAVNVNPGKTSPNKVSVYVSETGNTKDDFKGAPLVIKRIAANGLEPESVMASLSEYAGKKVWIAIVNEGKDNGLLGISSVDLNEFFGSVINLTPLNVRTPQELPLDLVVSVQAPSDILVVRVVTDTGYDNFFTANIDLSQGVSNMRIQLPELPLVKRESLMSYNVLIYPNMEGITPLEVSSSVICTNRGYPVMIVEEEATGEKCGYCPAGAAGIERFSQEYPDRYIGIGVHCSNFATGVMTSESYGDNLLQSRFFSIQSLPAAVINRETTFSPTDFLGAQNMVESYLSDQSVAKATITRVDYNESDKSLDVKFDVNTVMPMPGVEFNAAVVLLADGLKGSDRRWYQTDYFSGTTKEEFLKNAEESWWPYMQFYCEYPSQSISPTDISYDHVAMGIWPDFNGEGYSLGGSVDNPDTFQGVIGLDIPMQTEANEFGVQDVEKTSVVVLIFNKADERIIAADKVSFVDFNKDLSKVESLEAENYYMPKGIYTISGLRLPDNTDLTTLPCGVYIIDGHKRIIR